jgi:hypothetical protein
MQEIEIPGKCHDHPFVRGTEDSDKDGVGIIASKVLVCPSPDGHGTAAKGGNEIDRSPTQAFGNDRIANVAESKEEEVQGQSIVHVGAGNAQCLFRVSPARDWASHDGAAQETKIGHKCRV